MSARPHVIVTDGLWRKSLSAIRSLGKAGYPVTVFGDSMLTTGFWSRYTSSRVTAPLASSAADAFGNRLLQELDRRCDSSTDGGSEFKLVFFK